MNVHVYVISCTFFESYSHACVCVCIFVCTFPVQHSIEEVLCLPLQTDPRLLVTLVHLAVHNTVLFCPLLFTNTHTHTHTEEQVIQVNRLYFALSPVCS